MTDVSGFNIYFVFIRYARAGVQAFFKGASPSVTSGAASHDAWLPPLTADLLLQPHLGLFPFPSYFSALHEFLATFYHSGTIQSKLHQANMQSPFIGYLPMSHRDNYNENMSFFDDQFSISWLNSFFGHIPLGHTLRILEHDMCLRTSLNSVSLNQNVNRFFTQLQCVDSLRLRARA